VIRSLILVILERERETQTVVGPEVGGATVTRTSIAIGSCVIDRIGVARLVGLVQILLDRLG